VIKRKKAQMNDSHFQHTPDSPYHLSAGALVYDSHNRVLVHVFTGGIYTLIRETIEPNESIEAAIHRGIGEEAGSTAELVRYLGAITGTVRNVSSGVEFEKTVLYFAARLLDWQPAQRDFGDEESVSELQWHDPQQLISIMGEQIKLTGFGDLDESVVMKRFLHTEETSKGGSETGEEHEANQ
jgi:hypothetical protein